MRYTIHTRCVEDVSWLSRRLSRPVWRVAAPTILAACYAGGFIATVSIEMMPIWAWLRFRSESIDTKLWPPLAFTMVIVAIAVILGRRVYVLLRVHILSIDALVLLCGSIFAVVYSLWLIYSH